MKRLKGRPGIDWDQLYVDWLNSGLTKNAFLRLKGYKYKGGTVSRNTRHWLKNLCKLSLKLHAQYMMSVKDKGLDKNYGVFPLV